MWHLDKPSKKILADYADMLVDALMDRITKSTALPQNVKDLLIPTAADGSKV